MEASQKSECQLMALEVIASTHLATPANAMISFNEILDIRRKAADLFNALSNNEEISSDSTLE